MATGSASGRRSRSAPPSACASPESRRARAVKRLPAQSDVAFRAAPPYVEFRAEPFDGLALFLVEYE